MRRFGDRKAKEERERDASVGRRQFTRHARNASVPVEKYDRNRDTEDSIYSRKGLHFVQSP